MHDTPVFFIPYNEFKTTVYKDSIDSLSRIHNDGDSVIRTIPNLNLVKMFIPTLITRFLILRKF